jgi:acetylornithine/N-succinyldiaminopimelate aminotransferase
MSGCFMNNYHRLPIVFTRGEGAWLFDAAGKKHLDFSSGIAVNCLGHRHPALLRAVNDQAAKLLHVSNYYQSDAALLFAEKLVKACSPSGMKNVFLANSGAEANEGAVKIARKYSLKKYGPGRHRIVTLGGSFHGRTITTLAATGQEKFHKDFGPFTEGFVHIAGGDLSALEEALDKKTTAGLFIEAVQGEIGIVPQRKDFIVAAAKLCAERDILLMFDEIQCGMGRTGTFLACEAYGVLPDLVTLAKGLSGGIPCGAVLAGEKTATTLEPGDHGSTFGGGPLAAAAGAAVLDIVCAPGFLDEIAEKGKIIRAVLSSWKHPRICEIRGRGLMFGIDIDIKAWPVVESCLSAGLLVLSAGQQTLRLLPPYIISREELEQGLDILKSVLSST